MCLSVFVNVHVYIQDFQYLTLLWCCDTNMCVLITNVSFLIVMIFFSIYSLMNHCLGCENPQGLSWWRYMSVSGLILEGVFCCLFLKILHISPCSFCLQHDLLCICNLSLELLLRFNVSTNHPCHSMSDLTLENICLLFEEVTLLTGTLVTPHTKPLRRNKENSTYMSNVFMTMINHIAYVLFLRVNGEWVEKYVRGTKKASNT